LAPAKTNSVLGPAPKPFAATQAIERPSGVASTSVGKSAVGIRPTRRIRAVATDDGVATTVPGASGCPPRRHGTTAGSRR
jgi:hypothetical protein